MNVASGLLGFVLLTAGCHSLVASEAVSASLVVSTTGNVQGGSLPAIAPSQRILLIQDPPNAVGLSDCVEYCSLTVASGVIATQWGRSPAPGAPVWQAPLRDLHALTKAHAFEPLQPLRLAASTAAPLHYLGENVDVAFDVTANRVEAVYADGRRLAIPLPMRTLTCEDDPETGEGHANRQVAASDIATWAHPSSGLVLLRLVYLGTDQLCTRAQWLVARP